MSEARRNAHNQNYWPRAEHFQFDFVRCWQQLVRKLEHDIAQMARNQTIINDIKRQCGVITEKK